MTDALFDVDTLDPGRRRRFADDTLPDTRLVGTYRLWIDQGPQVTWEEFGLLIVRCLDAWGVDVHDHDLLPFWGEHGQFDYGRWGDDIEWDHTDLLLDVTLPARDVHHAAGLVCETLDVAVRVLSHDWERIDRMRGPEISTYRPPS